jgi:Asp-tRNA(Asn)/Glu-tRNA(Gln) amidotransferase A subunit family amidase
MMTSQLCDLSATEGRRLIGERKLSPVDLLESCIARIEAVNPSINAVVTKAYDRARSEAKKAEAAVAQGEPLGILHGLPILIKDLNNTEGIRTTYGSPRFRDNVPNKDDDSIARLRSHGAIILGKTNTPEYGTGSNTTNRIFGATGNPFAPTLTCGGSSGGAGASLAAGMSPLANGSDSGASIRNPAAFCGVVGIRPTPGLVASSSRPIGLTTNGVEGPLGRCVADVALLLAAMAEYDSRDHMSIPIDPRQFLTLKTVDVSSLRIGFSEDLGFAPVDQVVRQTFRKKISTIAPSFALCEEAKVNFKDAESAYYYGVRGLYFLANFYEKYQDHKDDLDANLVSNIEDALRAKPEEFAKALVDQTRIYRDFQSTFQKYDILITPAANVLPFEHRILYPETLDGRPVRHYAEWFSISYAISLVGHPAISLPAGLDSQGTPFGLQVVGSRFGDHRLLEVAAALEALLQSNPETQRPIPDLSKLQ